MDRSPDLWNSHFWARESVMDEVTPRAVSQEKCTISMAVFSSGASPK
jgi:hypothetical protein